MLSLVLNHLPLLITGMANTLALILLAAMFGIVCAIALTYGTLSHHTWLKKIIHGYIFVIRGTPFLLQLYIIYYGCMQFPWIVHSPIGILLKSAMACAVLSLTLNTAAYSSVLFTGAIENLNQKEIIAAKALGLGSVRIFKSIILPQILFKILPVYSNELIMLLKCTAIASSITVIDIMGATQQMIGMTYQTIPCLIIAAIIYSVISAAIMIPSKLCYQHYCKKIGVI
jgi:His/Glu/Gln/Arg/opine family amino acid ABC transporter permease subunit